MVKVHLKRGDVSQFLYETSTEAALNLLLTDIISIYNGKLKIERICTEMEELAKHGMLFPPNMLRTLEEQIKELKLADEWGEKCSFEDGFIESKDPLGRRNGKAPNEKSANIINRTIGEARAKVSKDLMLADICLTPSVIEDVLDMLKGVVSIVFPMGLPPYDPIQMEFENKQDLSQNFGEEDMIEESQAQLWWAGRELHVSKKLSDFVGKNEKTKIIVKLQKVGQGKPPKEPSLSAEEQKLMLLHNYKRREELKKLEESDDDSYLNSDWADNKHLQKSFQGLNDIKWRPR